jgi:hypothetical protein
MTRHCRTLVLFAALGLAGCDGGTTDVSGTVKYKGKPVVYGTVVVLGADGQPKAGEIRPDGTFRVGGVRRGPARVAVSSPPPPGSEPPRKPKAGRDADDDKPIPEVPPAPPEVIKNWFPIPDKYGDPAKSELTAEVESGRPLDLDLK